LKEIQNISTLPKDFSGRTFPAEIAVHPSGKFVYGSNRGHDSIAIFSADKKTGQLTFVGTQSTKGKWPRHFEIDPTGKFLLVENEHSGDIFVFKIDLKSGTLAPTEASISVEGPQCVKFFPANK
jgi:6-phosphogluconolactonase